MIKDYITADKFKDICNFDFGDPIPHTSKRRYVMYADGHRYLDALSFIHNQSPFEFILVTDNSAPEINSTEVPHNLIHWFAMNPNFKHPKISPIPLGLERPKWHPTKMKMMFDAKETQRQDKAFCQFNPATKPEVREELLIEVSQGKIESDIFYCVNGQNFNHYLNNLKGYKYCFSPRGSAIDTHRTWEALYMGCVPITKKEAIHDFEDFDLPILFLNDWTDFNYQEVNGNFNSKLLTMTYWKNKIYSRLNDTHKI